MTCCFFSSFKTLLTSPRVSPSGRNQRPGLRFIVGRFSGDHQWPVLGDHRGLERAQGWLRLPNGRALNGFSHGYKRHGTTTLFAAFDIATGQVIAGHYTRRRRREFLDFMNDIVAAYPDREIHVVLDNLNTHKPQEDPSLKRQPTVRLHFTPTYSSWLN